MFRAPGPLGPLGIETGGGDTNKRNLCLGPLGPRGPWGSRQVGVIRTRCTGIRVRLGTWSFHSLFRSDQHVIEQSQSSLVHLLRFIIQVLIENRSTCVSELPSPFLPFVFCLLLKIWISICLRAPLSICDGFLLRFD